MIKKPNELTFSDKKFSMIIYGAPGVGKTTLALSAPNPILIDFDRGISRVKARHRKATIVCDKYEDVLKDIASPEFGEFETVVVDTGGSFVSFLQDWAIRENPAVNRQKNGALSLKGFGAVKSEFNRFTSMLRDQLNKNVIYIFHSEEQKDKDGNPQQRLLCEGAARNLVWQPCDFGGYVQMVGENRVISFTPTQEFFAKGCYGIEGAYTVKTLSPTEVNDFVTKLFDKARENIAAEAAEFDPLKKEYDDIMDEVAELIANIDTVEGLNDAVESIKVMNHVLTSKTESSNMLKDKAKSMGCTWNKDAGAYVVKEA